MSATTRAATEFAMPSLGADMTEGRITEWLVHPGDHVERGQIVVIVETDKSDIEVEVFEPGEIVELLVDEGAMVPVGAPIAMIAPAAPAKHAKPTKPTGPARKATPTGPAKPTRAARPAEPQVTVPPPPEAEAGRHVTSPLIRHLADELHVDTERVPGTGPGGRVHRDDIVAAATVARPAPSPPVGARRRITPRARRLLHARGIDPATLDDRPLVTGADVLALPAAAAAPEEVRPSRAETMRLRIASLMERSWHEIPHYHVAKRLDLTAAMERLRIANESRPVQERLVSGAVLMCAAARAAAAVPQLNGWWRDGRFEPAAGVRLGVVVSLRSGGIMVPTIDRGDELSPAEMMARLGELVQRARQGRLRASDMTEASITVTNLGDLGGDSVTGVIHPPQVAIVGFGAVHDEVWAVDGDVVIRPTVHASLGGDHRATDGVAGSRYLAQLQAQLDGALLEEL